MLSFSRGRPVARIDGGQYNGKIIHIYDESLKCCPQCSDACMKKKCCKNCQVASGGCGSCYKGGVIKPTVKKSKKKVEYEDDEDLDNLTEDDYEEPADTNYDFDDPEYEYDPYNYLDKNFASKYKRGGRITFKTSHDLADSLRRRQPPQRGKLLKELYGGAKKVLNDRLKKEIHIDDGRIQPLPRMEPNQVENIYIGAPSGAGKSSYARDQVIEYKKLHPKNRVFLFSRGDKDPVLDSLCIRIIVDKQFLKKPIDALKELTNSLCIFDDIDTFKDKELEKAIHKLRDDILETGRKAGISTISTSHQILKYKSTRDVLNESQCVVFFPKGGGVYAIREFLNKYCGLEKSQVTRILNLPSRWVAIYKTYPLYIIYEKGVYLL